ncbi:MAG: M1 family metallopeptidase [Bacteroidia bacterium]
MKKLFLILISVFFLSNLFAQDYEYRSAANPYYWKNRKPFDGYWQQDVQYKIKASLDDNTDIITGEEELTYYNNSPDTLSFVYFHLYQNAFVKGSYLEQLNLANDYKQKFGKYELAGKGIEIEELKINNEKLKITIDNTIMRVELYQPIQPNQQITFKIKFKTYFDGGGDQRRRMQVLKDKWGNKQFKVVHWYPRLCVYDRKFGWETDQHLGKEFYGDFGTYDAELSMPNNYVMDATGVLQNRNEVMPDELRAKLDVKNFKDKPMNSAPSIIQSYDGSTKTWKFHAVNVHDFAWVADPTFRIAEKNITLPNGNNVQCIGLAQEPHAAGWQDAAEFNAKIIQTYSRDIGMYAYPKMIVADAYDGMEYPMLTLDGGTSPGYYGLFAHEVGHNWFFGMVGNNETYRAALDEGFTQFLTSWCMNSIFGEVVPTKKNPSTRQDQQIYIPYLRTALNGDDMQLNTHSDDFSSALNHGGGYGLVYYKTATMLYNLQYVLGDELFLKAMQHYFDQWKICHPYFEDFRNSIINYTHVDLNWFFDEWLETTKKTDYAIWNVNRKNKETTTIGFWRKGEMQMPLDFTVYTKDSNYKFHIPNTYFQKKTDATILPMWKGWGLLNEKNKVEINIPKNKIKDIKIDPTHRLADVDQLDNSWKFPYTFSFDNLKFEQADRRNYQWKWRPDLWYNSVDGIKTGLKFTGSYLNTYDYFSGTVWYNTKLATDYSGNSKTYVNFDLSFLPQENHFQGIGQFKYIDGLLLLKIGGEYTQDKFKFTYYLKSIARAYNSDVDYLLYPQQWNSNMENYTLNFDLKQNFAYTHGNGNVKVSFRTSFLSDYDYNWVNLTWINHLNIWKFELHTRLFEQSMFGNNPAPESMLNLAGGNSEEMMDNAFTRSRGFVPTPWLGYGTDYNHFQFAGGLNLRGYAGYLVPVTKDGTQYYLNRGNSGMALNAELDFDKLIPLSPQRFNKYIHFDLYFFGDAGYIDYQFQPSTLSNLKDNSVSSHLMADAGNGIALTIKRWGNLNEIRPLTIRFDMPWYLSNTPFVDGQNIRFRWIVGLNRSF